MLNQTYLMQLVVGWTCVGVFVASALITILGIVQIIPIKPEYLRKLFGALIIEVIAIGVAFFAGLLELNPRPVTQALARAEQTQEELTETQESLREVETLPTREGDIPAVRRIRPRVYVHVPGPAAQESAEAARRILEGEGVLVPGIENVGVNSPNKTTLRYFKREEAGGAVSIAAALLQAGIEVDARYVPGYERSEAIRPGHYELWFGQQAS